MHPAVRKTIVGAQKIDGSTLETFRMVIAGYSLQDRVGKVRFFQESFILVVLGMPFLTFGSADLRFAENALGRSLWDGYFRKVALGRVL